MTNEPSRADVWARFAAACAGTCTDPAATAATADALLAEFDKRWEWGMGRWKQRAPLSARKEQ